MTALHPPAPRARDDADDEQHAGDEGSSSDGDPVSEQHVVDPRVDGREVNQVVQVVDQIPALVPIDVTTEFFQVLREP